MGHWIPCRVIVRIFLVNSWALRKPSCPPHCGCWLSWGGFSRELDLNCQRWAHWLEFTRTNYCRPWKITTLGLKFKTWLAATWKDMALWALENVMGQAGDTALSGHHHLSFALHQHAWFSLLFLMWLLRLEAYCFSEISCHMVSCNKTFPPRCAEGCTLVVKTDVLHCRGL